MRLIARLPNGEVIGSIAPYGNAGPGSYTIDIPRHGVREDNTVTLHFELRDREGKVVRAPTERELAKVELYLIQAR